VKGAIFSGSSVKEGPKIKNYSEIHVDIAVTKLPECRILPFLEPQES
jgi:hypothetical protein